jgi:hypothetical protein
MIGRRSVFRMAAHVAMKCFYKQQLCRKKIAKNNDSEREIAALFARWIAETDDESAGCRPGGI